MQDLTACSRTFGNSDRLLRYGASENRAGKADDTRWPFALATLSALPLLHWLMSRELTDVVDDRVSEGAQGFEVELADDIRDLEAATTSLADSDELEDALKDSNTQAIQGSSRGFTKRIRRPDSWCMRSRVAL